MEEKVNDSKFIDGINYLIKNKIIIIIENQQELLESKKIPSWIKTTTGWWIDGQIDDDQFLNMIGNLVKEKIIII